MHDLHKDFEHLRDFVQGLPSVTSAAELERLLSTHIGVDPACVTCANARVRSLGGLRVHPGRLARCLWDLRDVAARAHTFLHVGTHHGHSFVAVSEFLKHANPHIDMHTVDEHNYALTETLPYVMPYRMVRPTRDLAGRHYDLVFIESGSPDDYRAVGQYAGTCVWHCPQRAAVTVSPLQNVRTTYGDIVVLKKSRGGV